MKSHFSKYVIIGAGLSGLSTAYQLYTQGETDFVILESRDRIGGRILTHDHIDLGATWFQNHHQNVLALLDELQLKKFYQYSKGKSVLVYNSMAPEHYFENDPNAPSAYRIAGGSVALINALAAPFRDQILTSGPVTAITASEETLAVTTSKGIYTGEKVVVCIPPKITTRIAFSPELPDQLTLAMEKTHTWMSNAMKIGMTFSSPFWRTKNLSGTVIGQVGAVTELYDHSDAADENYALMGFINEGLRDVSAEARKERILAYLSKYLGPELLLSLIHI